MTARNRLAIVSRVWQRTRPPGRRPLGGAEHAGEAAAEELPAARVALRARAPPPVGVSQGDGGNLRDGEGSTNESGEGEPRALHALLGVIASIQATWQSFMTSWNGLAVSAAAFAHFCAARPTPGSSE